jgi:hypothetical protein
LGVWDQEDLSLRSAQANSSRDPTSEIPRTNWTGEVAQVEECLLCKLEALSSNPIPTPPKNPTKQLLVLLGYLPKWTPNFLNCLCSQQLSVLPQGCLPKLSAFIVPGVLFFITVLNGHIFICEI